MNSTNQTIKNFIELLDLAPLAREGGYFKETYRSGITLEGGALGSRYGEVKSISTCIFYLLTPDSFSQLHRLISDEIYHFYVGDPVDLINIDRDGQLTTTVLGSDVLAGQAPQKVVPQMVWQGSRLRPGGRFALMGLTVAPGFDFSDYENGEREALIRQYPQHMETIVRYTREVAP